jgi:hypothetical protein
VISRLLVIVLSFGAAFYRLSEGATVEGVGLLGLGGGLLCLRLASRWPVLKRLSLIGFAMTAIAMVIALSRLSATTSLSQ